MSTTPTIDELSHLVSTRGVAGAERELAEFAWRLARAGIAPTLTGVILDTDAPAIVRERAFARAAIEARRAPITRLFAA